MLTVMARKNVFKGLGIALVTPFDSDGTIDFTALSNLVETQIAGGTDFLCVLGTTAETPCLSPEEREEVKACVVRTAAGRVPLLLGCGGNNTAEVCHYLRHANLEGFSGVLIVCPYYNKPTQEGLFRHFCAVAEASPLPVILYNVPGRTGCNMEAETTLRIARACENVVAIKEASGKTGQIAEIIANAPEGFDVLSGDDALTFELLQGGAAGVISVIGNAYPGEFGQMVRDTLAGRTEEAGKANQALTGLYRLMTTDGNPAGIKALLSVKKLIGNNLRLPLVPAREETMSEIAEAEAAFARAKTL